MKIRKVVFPVAGLGTRFYPITKSVPKEMIGVLDKPLIHYAFEEALNSGIEQCIFITRQGKNAIEDYFDYLFFKLKRKYDKHCDFCYIRQEEPLGFGHAVMKAEQVINCEPFAVMCADDLIVSKKPCIASMIESYDGSNMAAVMSVPNEDVNKYGIIEIDKEKDNFIKAKSVCEKPSIENAKSNLAIVGRYILSPEIFKVIKNLDPGTNGELQLTDALDKMIPLIGLTGFKFDGKRFDCGNKEGLLSAILNVSMNEAQLKETVLEFCKKHSEIIK